MHILHREFDIDVNNIPPLATEIYMNVLKKFLKLWPRWDTVDRIVQQSKDDKTIDIEMILQKEYESLKTYLNEMLTLSREPVQATLKKVNSATSSSKESRVVLDVHCSRQQLNSLINRVPDCEQNMTIFNSVPKRATKINTLSLQLSQIFYWPGLSIEIDAAQVFQYTRKNIFDMTHTLVNHKLGTPPVPPAINRYVYSRAKKSNVHSQFPHKTVMNFLERMEMQLDFSESDNYATMLEILHLIKKDVSHCPRPIDRNCEYMYYLSRYPYVRHLFKEPTSDSTTKPDGTNVSEELQKYDLELFESVAPKVVFSINPYSKIKKDGTVCNVPEGVFLNSLLQDREQWIRFKCTYCEAVFNGLRSVTKLRYHFTEVHWDEMDTQCSRCDKTFSVPALTAMKWTHNCSEP